MSQKPMSFRPRNEAQREEFALLCFVLDMDVSEALRLAVDSLLPSEKRATVAEIAPAHTSREVMSFRPRDQQQKEDFAWLASELDLDVSKMIRLAIDTLIKKHRGQMEEIRPLYEAGQSALEQARQSLHLPDKKTKWARAALQQAQENLQARKSLQESE